jgi:hypothetical protein
MTLFDVENRKAQIYFNEQARRGTSQSGSFACAYALMCVAEQLAYGLEAISDMRTDHPLFGETLGGLSEIAQAIAEHK